jgi:hypothetical protein
MTVAFTPSEIKGCAERLVLRERGQREVFCVFIVIVWLYCKF